MKSSILTIAKNLANLVYPLHCASCAKGLEALDDFGVCGFCKSRISRNPKPYFASSDFDRAYSACLYEGVLKELIHTFKYKRKISLSKIFSRLLAEYIKDHPEITEKADIITFVPLHNRRLKEREFNQSKLLASSISDAFKIPLIDTLDKTRTTRNQNELSRNERLVNLNGVFTIRSEANVTGKSILLIDDVMTTGATLNECAKILKGGGAREVICLTLARGV